VELVATVFRQVFVLLVAGQITPVADEVKFCPRRARFIAGLLNLIENFVDLLQIVDQLNLGRCDVFNEVRLVLEEADTGA